MCEWLFVKEMKKKIFFTSAACAAAHKIKINFDIQTVLTHEPHPLLHLLAHHINYKSYADRCI